MNKIRRWLWRILEHYFSEDVKSKYGIYYSVPYKKNKIVQFFHIFSLYRYAWHTLTLRAYLASSLYNCEWINTDVFERMMKGKKHNKNWQIEWSGFEDI